MTSRDPRNGPRGLVVVVPDGASEPGTLTSLARADTPHLDALCADQGVGRLMTIPDGQHPGTEIGVPRLMGITSGVPGRGWLEAAAIGVEVGPDRCAWRLDVVSGAATTAERAKRKLRSTLGTDEAADVEVHALGERRWLLIGPAWWGDAAPGHDRRLPPAWRARLGPVEESLGVRLRAWGRADRPSLSAREDVAVLPDSTAVRGLARAVGAVLLSDLPDALNAISTARHGVVVLHDSGPDRAGHARDPSGKRAVVERFDAMVVGPVVAASRAAGAAVIVAPDHGCDAATGAHTGDAVPATWPGAPGAGRLTESATARLPVVDAVATVHGLAPRLQEVA